MKNVHNFLIFSLPPTQTFFHPIHGFLHFLVKNSLPNSSVWLWRSSHSLVRHQNTLTAASSLLPSDIKVSFHDVISRESSARGEWAQKSDILYCKRQRRRLIWEKSQTCEMADKSSSEFPLCINRSQQQFCHVKWSDEREAERKFKQKTHT